MHTILELVMGEKETKECRPRQLVITVVSDTLLVDEGDNHDTF